ncbi:MAG TPA: hypothetical protein VF744_03940 [Beijerinckiaceae bacterium]|jgi:hypothetical protein
MKALPVLALGLCLSATALSADLPRKGPLNPDDYKFGAACREFEGKLYCRDHEPDSRSVMAFPWGEQLFVNFGPRWSPTVDPAEPVRPILKPAVFAFYPPTLSWNEVMPGFVPDGLQAAAD